LLKNDFNPDLAAGSLYEMSWKNEVSIFNGIYSEFGQAG
jgi:hypothetical protein